MANKLKFTKKFTKNTVWKRKKQHIKKNTNKNFI